MSQCTESPAMPPAGAARTSGEEILAMLKETYPGSPSITMGQFREFLGISRNTDKKMRRQNQYPRIITCRDISRKGASC